MGAQRRRRRPILNFSRCVLSERGDVRSVRSLADQDAASRHADAGPGAAVRVRKRRLPLLPSRRLTRCRPRRLLKQESAWPTGEARRRNERQNSLTETYMTDTLTQYYKTTTLQLLQLLQLTTNNMIDLY